MLNVSNIITLIRLGLVPLIAYCLVTAAYGIAFLLFLVAALSDLVDGIIARRFKLISTVGAALDPIADKLNMLAAAVLLAWQTLLPTWLAIAIVARDLLIVIGALVYRMAFGHMEIAPTRLSKINTAIEFTILLLAMALGAGWIKAGDWMRIAFLTVMVTIIISTTEYVWTWGHKAVREGWPRRTDER